MSLTIYKFQLVRGEVTTLPLPADARILCVGAQRERLYLWALLDTVADQIDRTFHVYGTGWDLSSLVGLQTYHGTIFEGSFVWHVFESVKAGSPNAD